MTKTKNKESGTAAKTPVKVKKTYKPGSLMYIAQRLKKNPGAMVGIIVILTLIVLSLLSPWICRYSYEEYNIRNQYATPSAEHLLGCDEIGRDILSRVLYGARYTLAIGVMSTLVSLIIGVILGAIAGYFGGVIDNFIMRFLDVFQAIPGMLMAITISTVLGPGFDKIILALGISGISGYARMMRANILKLRNSEFIEAATSINCSTFRIVAKHVIPNALSPLIVQVAMGIASAGLSASALSFLGFGVQPPTPEWGSMLSGARKFIRDYPHMVIVPGTFIMISVLAFNLIGDAVRDALDPKLRD